MIKKCIIRALNCFLRSEKATTEKLFDDLGLAEKAMGLEEYFRLPPEQQKAVVSFLTDEAMCRSVCGFLCYLANRANENEAVLFPGNFVGVMDDYNKSCSNVFGTVDPEKILAFFSVDGLKQELGFKNPCLLLVNNKLPKLAFFGLLHGIAGYAGTIADTLIEKYGFGLDKNFNDFSDMEIPEEVIDGLIDANQESGRGTWILTRMLITCEKLDDSSLAKIADQLFAENDISPMQVSLINSCSEQINIQRLLEYVEPLYRESILVQNPRFFYLFAALEIAKGADFLSANAVRTICESDDVCEIALALGQVSLNALAVLYHATSMMGFRSAVTVTEGLMNRMLEFLSGDEDSLYYAAYTCLRDLVAIGQFDNNLLQEAGVVYRAIENLRNPVDKIKRAAEVVLGLLPLSPRRLLPSSIALRFFSFYKRCLRHEEYDWRLVLYFRTIVNCGAWRRDTLLQHYRQVYQYYLEHAGSMSREEEILLQLTRQELPRIDKSLTKNSGTDVRILRESLKMPSVFDICSLSCKADRLALSPDARVTLTVKEAQAVISLAMREKLGMQTEHIHGVQIKTLLSCGDLPEEGVGSFLIVQMFQWICSYNCGPAAVAFYTRYRQVLDRPCFYLNDGQKCTFTKFGEFLQIPTRVEMCIAEALMVGSTTVAQLFAAEAFAPMHLTGAIREKIAEMIEKRKTGKLPVSEDLLIEWLDLGPDLMSLPDNAWHRFYDDQGVTALAVEEAPACHETVLEFGYSANETVAAIALRKDPLSFNYVAASLQHSEVILQAMRDGIKSFEDDQREGE